MATCIGIMYPPPHMTCTYLTNDEMRAKHGKCTLFLI